MAELVGPAIEVGKCIAGPIKRQFNYLCCFNANIRNLRDEARRMDDAKEGLQRRVELAKRNAEDVVPAVETWLGDADKIQENYIKEIEPEILNVKCGCLAIKSHYSLSRKATKMVEAMKKLQDDDKFEQIAIPALPASMASLIPHGQTCELQSRKHFEDDIMATLREKKVSMMGICGMGGVGKTTMAKKIMSRAREESLFHEIVIAVVSQPVDMFRIQREIADSLGLELKVESILARAHLLRTRLMNTKSILIVLDDLWKGLNLKELGIPHQRECTILLTSRDRDVFSAMNVEKSFQMKILEDEEAWSLFKEKVGACAEDQSLIPTAQDIVRECKGLPIALVTVGAALKDKTSKSIWKNAVEDLRSSNPKDIPDFLAQVYNPLKLSYDLLESEHAKSIFLLCCLFPEDRNIPISNLSLYAWGLGMFEGIRSLQVARNKVQTLVEMLKSRFLLMDSLDGGHVKMHDVIHDVGIFIAAKEGLMDPNVNWNSWLREENNCSIDCTWISLFHHDNTRIDQITLPGGSVFPKLSFLLIEGEHSLSDDFSESSRKLRVLSISNYTLRSLPHTIQLLNTLRTLILVNCKSLKDLSVVGELVCLEILYCQWCPLIKELPVEIRRLNQLKLLHIWDCENLETIARGVISKLIRLEELTLIASFSKWESRAASEGRNAALCELNFLSNLTRLRIQIKDVSLAAEQIHLPNVVEFNITIGEPQNSLRYEVPKGWEREMNLELGKEVIIGYWIHQLLRTTQTLRLDGQGSSKLLPFIFLRAMRNNYPLRLKSLTIQSCLMLEQVVLWNEEKNEQTSRRIAFPKLEEMILKDLPRLTTLCKGIGSTEFPALTRMKIMNCPNLKSLVSSTTNHQEKCLHLFCKPDQAAFGRLEHLIIDGYDSISSLWCDQIPIDLFTGLVDLTISSCGNIKSLFSVSIAINLVNLRKLSIVSCREMVKVIEDKVNEVERSPFINLQTLRLEDLPKLKAFCDWICALELPSLIHLVISKFPMMDRFPFGIFTSQISSDSFKNLKHLKIESCSMLEQVVLWNEEENGQSSRRITFPKLEGLTLDDLPRLTSFCKGIQSIEFPLLTEMEIKKCPNLKSLISSTVNDHKYCSGAINHDSLHLFCKEDQATFGRLEYLYIDGYDSISSLWCDQIPIGFFTGLDHLRVLNCGNIKSLFTPSIAKNLVNLTVLIIESCHEMVKVIDEEEVERSPFIKLQALYLIKLPKLKAFCDWRCALELPSLIRVYIYECPKMERFSFGSLTTPKLEEIKINYEDISDCTKDLNDAVGDFLHLDILFGSDE